MAGDARACDADQPGCRFAARRVVRVAVANRALEDLARHILGVRACTEPVRDVAVHAPDQRRRIGKWIATDHHVAVTWETVSPVPAMNSRTSGLNGLSMRATASSCFCATLPRGLASARS